jgi:predicted membrane-bound spermidine synthase
MNRKNIYWGIFLIALSTLFWEILLTRIFSATMYYHFVFMSISLAMLGFGCSGVVVFLFPRFFSKEKSDNHLSLFSILLSVTIFVAIIVYLRVNSQITPSLSSFLVLFKIFFFIFLPYFFSGIIITLILKHYAKNVTTLYCCDLIGAGLGCILVICLLFIYDGISLVLLTSFMAATASIVFARQCSSRILKRLSLCIAFLSLIAFIGNAYFYRFLRINYVQGTPQTGIIFEEWNPINRVTVTPQNYFGNKSLRINYDAAALAHMNFFDGDIKKVSYLQSHMTSFYYQIRGNGEVLIIGVGGGQDVLSAYINGHRKIDGIEINPTIARLNTVVYRGFNGDLFAQPGIKMFVDDGRNFVRHSTKKYDIIHLSNVDSGVASSSGAFTFVENSLYTVEAFKDYYRHLKDDGVLWIGRWRFRNDSENFRVLTSALRALEELGINEPDRHIVMIAEKPRPEWCQALFLLKKGPFLPEEIKAMDDLRTKMNLEWLHHPEKKMDNPFDDYLFSTDKNAFLKRYPLRVDPSTDNCPFFFNFLKPTHYFWKLPDMLTHFTYPVFMFKALFVIVSIMVFLAIVLPLIIFKWNSASHSDPALFRGGYLSYFTCLGLGFMLVEIPLIQKFILFLGQPLYAIAVILSTLLISSGTGSLLAGRFSDQTTLKGLRTLIFILSILLVIYIYGLPVTFETFLGKSGLARVVLSIMLICPLGLLMGMAFPLGIRLLERDGSAMIPWVWGVNGACSVMGSILAWGLSLNFGYNATLWAATVIYGCAWLVMILKPQSAL